MCGGANSGKVTERSEVRTYTLLSQHVLPSALTEVLMSRKRRAAKKLKTDRLIPLQWSSERPWYRAPSQSSGDRLGRLLGNFGAAESRQELPRAARRRRKI